MNKQRTYQLGLSVAIKAKLADYAQLIKLRLAIIVVFSAGIGFLFGNSGAMDWGGFFLVMLGGFFITGAANALNEVIEKDFDKLMSRTENRPLPSNRMSVMEALLIAGILSIAGLFLLAFFFNVLSALIGALSLLIYAFIYTPLKRYSSFAVFVGAIPGALPPLIGWVAATGSLHFFALLLFTIQFLWQFPHFWAIAWIAHDDYSRAGYDLLPSKGGKCRESAIMNIIYSGILIPASLMPYLFGYTGWISAIVLGVAGSIFMYQSFKLFKDLTDQSARKLMFGSFFYLPVVLLALIIDKL